MKNIILVLLICFTICSCTSKTQYGDCIGLTDDPQPNLVYKFSWWNGAVAFFFSETIIVPVYTLAKEIECPTGVK